MATGQERLKKLVEVLEGGLEGVKLDMCTWGTLELDERTQEITCGTTACAMGHAMLHPWFHKEGLKASWKHLQYGKLYPVYLAYGGWEAVERFFEISEKDAERVFGPYMSGKETVINRIHELIR